MGPRVNKIQVALNPRQVVFVSNHNMFLTLPEPTFTYHHEIQWQSLEGNFTKDSQKLLKLAYNCPPNLKFHSNLPWANELIGQLSLPKYRGTLFKKAIYLNLDRLSMGYKFHQRGTWSSNILQKLEAGIFSDEVLTWTWNLPGVSDVTKFRAIDENPDTNLATSGLREIWR